uniref:Uncharacterized protein n=1 Tax=Arundo donax TaxID=35708 RepID=A0A0A9DM86_ARUDO
MIILPYGLVLGVVLQHRPAQQGHGERHREVELDVVAGVVVAADEAALHILRVGAVRQAGVAAPFDAVVLRKPAGFLGVEEEERLVEGLGVLIVGRRAGLLVGDRLGDDDGETDKDEGADEGPEGPPEDLALDDDAAEVDVPVLLLGLRRAKQPALLRLVQLVVLLPRQRAAVQVHVPAVVVLRRPVGGDLERPAPVVRRVHGCYLPGGRLS